MLAGGFHAACMVCMSPESTNASPHHGSCLPIPSTRSKMVQVRKCKEVAGTSAVRLDHSIPGTSFRNEVGFSNISSISYLEARPERWSQLERHSLWSKSFLLPASRQYSMMHDKTLKHLAPTVELFSRPSSRSDLRRQNDARLRGFQNQEPHCYNHPVHHSVDALVHRPLEGPIALGCETGMG